MKSSAFTKVIAVLTAGIIAASSFTVTGFAASDDEITSKYSVSYEGSVVKPTYAIMGTKGKRSIRLSSKTSGATIYYTTDGTTPTTSSKKYSGLITIKKATKIRAIAVSGSSKSAVMTKTVKVATLVGDVTGDGTINNNDYTRLKSYLNDETKYICYDNADTSGNGSVKNKDLTLLKQYLNEEISSFPASSTSTQTSTTLASPTSVVYRIYNGKKVVFSCSDDDADIYYTLNGSKPTKNSFKYNQAIIVNDDCTIRYIAYKNGTYSKSKTKTITINDCATVTSDKDTSKQYDDKLEVKLSCATSASKIYYTIDGTDPTSNGKLYTGAITLTADTTIKAYSRCKGYADSGVVSFQYKVAATGYSISGVVWDDTVSESSVSDGIRQNTEVGINGITVYLLNTATNAYDKTTTTATLDGVVGSYKFDNLKANTSYKVVFMYNGQRYRAYDYIVSGGNQATAPAVPPLSISNNGTTNTTTESDTSTINSYKGAIASSLFSCYATTSATYNKTTANVNLALKTNVYGKLSLTLVPTAVKSATTGATTSLSNVSGQTVAAGDTLTYNLTLTNASATQVLSDGTLMLYLDSDLSIQNIVSSNGRINYSYAGTLGSYNAYVIKNFVAFSSLAQSQSITFTISATVNAGVSNTSISNSAEVLSYRFASSCYDGYSIPGNIVVGTKKENDEAVSVAINVGTAVVAQTLTWQTVPQLNAMTASAGIYYATVVVGNTSTVSGGVYLSSSNTGSVACTVSNTMVVGNNTYITIAITPKSIGSSVITVMLASDTTKTVSTTATVIG